MFYDILDQFKFLLEDKTDSGESSETLEQYKLNRKLETKY